MVVMVAYTTDAFMSSTEMPECLRHFVGPDDSNGFAVWFKIAQELWYQAPVVQDSIDDSLLELVRKALS